MILCVQLFVGFPCMLVSEYHAFNKDYALYFRK